MDSFGRNLLRFGFVLGLVCALAGGLLAWVNTITSVKIEENRRIEMAKKRIEVMPDADPGKFEEKEAYGHKYVWAYDKSGKKIGTIFQITNRGYGGPINITMGINEDNTLSGIAISKLDQSETPGLGMKITTSKFKDQFRNKKKSQIALRNKGGEIDAVTAATISSKAVINGVLKGFSQYEKDLEQLR